MISTIFSIWTVVVFILFIGIVIWAWSSKRKADFDEAAMIPLNEDDDEVIGNEGEQTNA